MSTLTTFASDESIDGAWVTALGAFEWVEVCEYTQGTQQYTEPRRFGPCEILALQGNLSWKDGVPLLHAHVTLSRELVDRIEVFGGHLVDGQVFALEARIDVFDAPRLERERDEATGLHLWSGGERAAGNPAGSARASAEDARRAFTRAREEAAAAAPSAWSEVARVSDEASRASPPMRRIAPKPIDPLEPYVVPDRVPERTRDASFLDEPVPERGDWVDHRQFGLCRIDRIEDDGALLIRTETGRRRRISLDVLEVLPPRDDGKRKIFPLRSKKA
jgi:predicted DNA-binding protein with PD1-like motif